MAGFDVLFAVMPLMCFLSGCLQNRASAWGMVGFDLVCAAMPLMCFLSGCLQNRASAWGMAGFDLVFAAMPLTCFLSRRSLWLCVLRPRVCKIEHLHGEWLVLMCCAAPDVCHERVLLKSSVYMGNGWP